MTVSDTTSYVPAFTVCLRPEPDLEKLQGQLSEHNITHFRTVGGKVYMTVGRLNRKSVPYSVVTASTYPYPRIESFGHAPLNRHEQEWLERIGGNQWK